MGEVSSVSLRQSQVTAHNKGKVQEKTISSNKNRNLPAAGSEKLLSSLWQAPIMMLSLWLLLLKHLEGVRSRAWQAVSPIRSFLLLVLCVQEPSSHSHGPRHRAQTPCA